MKRCLPLILLAATKTGYRSNTCEHVMPISPKAWNLRSMVRWNSFAGYPLAAFLLLLAAGNAWAATQCTLSSPLAGAVLPPSIALAISCPSGIVQLNIRVGTAAYESDQPWNVANITINKPSTSFTESVSIPQNGSPIFVTLLSEYGKVWEPAKAYAFTEGSSVVTTPVLKASASSIAFGNVYDGQTASGNVTLSSTGTASVVISSVVPTGTGFGALALPVTTLAPGATEILTATFAPTVPGAVTGAVTIDSNAGVLTVGLNGTGVAVAVAYEVELSWEAPSGSDPAASYVVQRALVTSGVAGAYSAIGTSPGASYDDVAVVNGDEYSYRVVALDASGNQSAPSSPALAAIP